MKLDKLIRKKLRIRTKLRSANKNNRPRLTVTRSSKNISAQIIDDNNSQTLVAVSSLEKEIKKINRENKSDLSIVVGEILAKRANEKKITKIYFDRGCYKYHGRVKLFTESLRKHGMEF